MRPNAATLGRGGERRGREGETEKGREGRKEGGGEGGFPHTIRHSYITYSKDMSWGRGRGGRVEERGGRGKEREGDGDGRREKGEERREKGEEGGRIGQGWAYPTTPLLPSLPLSALPPPQR